MSVYVTFVKKYLMRPHEIDCNKDISKWKMRRVWLMMKSQIDPQRYPSNLLLNEFFDRLMISVMKRQTNCTGNQICCLQKISVGLQKFFYFSTNRTKVQTLDYQQMTRRVNVSGVLFLSSSKQKGRRTTWLQVIMYQTIWISTVYLSGGKMCKLSILYDRLFTFLLNLRSIL